MTSRIPTTPNLPPPQVRKRIPNPAFNISHLGDTTLYHFFMNFCLILVLIILLLLGFIFYQRTHKPISLYYAVDHDPNTMRETNVRLYPLNHPNLTTEALMKWAIEAATACYNFDFYNYRTSLEYVRIYFTKAGYANFISALTTVGTLKDIETKKLVVSGVLTSTPVILKEGSLTGGTYGWKIQLPMLVTYQSASDRRKQNIILTLMITNVPTLESVKGVGIASFIEKRSTG